MVAVAVLVALHCAPTAFAVSPPPVDGSLLPPPAAAAPPEPTEQREPCTVLTRTAPKVRAHQLDGVDLPTLWRLTRGAGQRVAVIDTGVQPHPRLPAVVAGGDYVSTGDGRQDCDGHGTIVAGIIAAQPDESDSSGFAGIAPEATVIAVRQSSTMFGPASQPSARGSGDVETLAKAVRTAADMGASVINISSVACAEGMLDDRVLGAALAYAVDVKDAVVVAAAGNVGGPGQCSAQNTGAQSSVISSPAWYDDYVLTVASVDAHDNASPFSLHGPWVDVAAHGEAVVSLDRSGPGVVDTMAGTSGPLPISGTSYAAPVVSGVVALVRARFPRLTARQVMSRITESAHKPSRGWDSAVGNGVVDPLAALSDQPVAAPTTPPAPVAVPDVSPTRRAEPRAVIGAGAVVCLIGIAAAASMWLRHRPTDHITPR